MADVKLSQIRKLVSTEKIIWTEHVAMRIRERGIKRADLIECIKNGEIIEQYPDDKPFPSCLIFGTCSVGEPLHIVVGLNSNILCCMITTYRPDTQKWENDFKTRKVGVSNDGLFSL